jgi:hypothetical protein
VKIHNTTGRRGKRRRDPSMGRHLLLTTDDGDDIRVRIPRRRRAHCCWVNGWMDGWMDKEDLGMNEDESKMHRWQRRKGMRRS